MKFALIGNPIKHSLSPMIHGFFFDQQGTDGEYVLEELDCLGEQEINYLKANYDGFNCTIPFKQAIIPYLDEIDEGARALGAVNTVLCRDGKLIGYNTDADGFRYALTRHGIELRNKRVLVLGAGGVARVLAAVAAEQAEQVDIYSRTYEKSLALAEQCRKDSVRAIEEIKEAYDCILNGTPVGMWPKVHACPLENLDGVESVYDTVYNPSPTLLVARARKAGGKAYNGLDMLVAQAANAQEIWLGTCLDRELIDRACLLVKERLREAFPQTILLTGFMGSGKSTVGRQLAERLGVPFQDLDAMIEERAGRSIPEIFRNEGEEAFRDLEHQVLAEAVQTGGKVLATGGGALTYDRNIELVRQHNTCVIYLNIDFETALVRTKGSDRPKLKNGLESEAKQLYDSRFTKYWQASDIEINGNVSVEQVVEEIIHLLEGVL